MAKKKITGSSTKSIEQAIENALGFGTLEARSGPDPDKGETFRLPQTTVEVGTISGGPHLRGDAQEPVGTAEFPQTLPGDLRSLHGTVG
jgi:hypothetical protein